ncbi:hypothetical protein [Streptomyces sp. NBC_00989]|uniref:hypothetical protein n=1 Tax=Streptomyces sp. NBC_00989 TaxID=2903705 RepID=UPI00386F7A51|nr:hypothetical protein OG714_38260 [Streptomyces sp. NBC_00989]
MSNPLEGRLITPADMSHVVPFSVDEDDHEFVAVDEHQEPDVDHRQAGGDVFTVLHSQGSVQL